MSIFRFFYLVLVSMAILVLVSVFVNEKEAGHTIHNLHRLLDERPFYDPVMQLML